MNWKNPQTQQEATIQIMGFDPAYPAFTLSEVNQQLHKLKLPQVVLFDRGTRGEYDQTIAQLERGNILTTEAEGQTLSIRGLFTLGASFGTDGFLMTSDQNFLLLFSRRDPGSLSLGLLDVRSGYDSEQVAKNLNAHLPEDVNALTLEQFIQAEEDYWKRQSPVGFIFTLGAAMAFVVGVVIVYQVLSTDVNAHIKEYATFKAMGYRQTYLLGIVFEETIILAFLGFIPGSVISIYLYKLAVSATALPIFMTLSRALWVFLLTVLMCLISGGIATRKLQSADPADMF
jgi:putative ABC transport system permease protein